MFIGHFAVALGAKKFAPKQSIATMFIAAKFLDLLWPLLVIFGIENVSVDHTITEVTPFIFHYPYSHSLGMSLIWSVLAYGIFKMLKRSNKEALIIACLVFSHWVLDFVTHAPDMPLWIFEGPKFGLGLWNNKMATFIIEVGIFLGGSYLYLKQTNSFKRKGSLFLLLFLFVMYCLNIFGPKPPVTMTAIQIATPALSMWLIVAWAYYLDKSKE